RAHRDHRLGLLRTRQGPALRQLHGALRLRAVRRAGHDGLAARDDQGRPRQLIAPPTLLAGLAAAKARTAGPSTPAARDPRSLSSASPRARFLAPRPFAPNPPNPPAPSAPARIQGRWRSP